MRKALIVSLPLVAVFSLITLTLAAPTSPPTTAPSTGTGSIHGTVMNDGKPLVNATVRLLMRAVANVPSTSPSTTGKHHRAARPARGEMVAQTQTDFNGNFSFANIANGNYVVIARDRAAGVGGAGQVSVSGSESSTVSISAKQHKGKGKN